MREFINRISKTVTFFTSSPLRKGAMAEIAKELGEDMHAHVARQDTRCHVLVLRSDLHAVWCPVLFCPVLSCPVLSCPVLSCHWVRLHTVLYPGLRKP